MFTKKLIETNMALFAEAVKLHKSGKITPNSLVIDVDTLIDNARRILESARKRGLKVYYMLKQIGRNPYLAKKLEEIGYDGAVVVDYDEFTALKGLKIGNVGHLVQVPDAMVREVVKSEPDMITVYSIEKAKRINEEAGKLAKVGKIAIRVIGESDVIYPGQEAGVELKDLKPFIKELISLKSLQLVAVTSFPCFLFDGTKGAVSETPNMETLRQAKRMIDEEYEIEVEVNAPSANSISTMGMARKAGATIVEPGHSLTGTSLEHLETSAKGTEKLAYLYLTEISHMFRGKAYAYGGGYYRRSNMKNCIVVGNDGKKTECSIGVTEQRAIDYTLELDCPHKVSVGDTVISAHRTQIFVTRAKVVLIEGLANGKPQIVGTYTSLGSEAD